MTLRSLREQGREPLNAHLSAAPGDTREVAAAPAAFGPRLTAPLRINQSAERCPGDGGRAQPGTDAARSEAAQPCSRSRRARLTRCPFRWPAVWRRVWEIPSRSLQDSGGWTGGSPHPTQAPEQCRSSARPWPSALPKLAVRGPGLQLRRPSALTVAGTRAASPPTPRAPRLCRHLGLLTSPSPMGSGGAEVQRKPGPAWGLVTRVDGSKSQSFCGVRAGPWCPLSQTRARVQGRWQTVLELGICPPPPAPYCTHRAPGRMWPPGRGWGPALCMADPSVCETGLFL